MQNEALLQTVIATIQSNPLTVDLAIQCNIIKQTYKAYDQPEETDNDAYEMLREVHENLTDFIGRTTKHIEGFDYATTTDHHAGYDLLEDAICTFGTTFNH